MTLIDRKLEDWKRKLLDLTRRNPALFFKPEKPFNLRLNAPDPNRLLLGLLVEERKRVLFIPPPLPTAHADTLEDEDLEDEDYGAPAVPGLEDICFVTKDGKALRRRIKSLHRAAQADFEERALHTLHLAVGLLQWRDGGNEVCVSPLLLVPVKLERDAEKDSYTLGPADDDPVLNPSLVAKLAESFRITLRDIPEDWEEQSYASWLESIREAVRPYKWSVEDSSWLARFSFHKLSLYHDLKMNAERLKESALIRALAGEPYSGDGAALPALPDDKNLDREIRPHESYVVLDADSSQLVCVEAVERGHNLIVQGPPGTGKSQTIVNLIAQLLAKGKTVLFVSEKIAALEVVFKRLKGAGLGDLCLELHSHKANKREVVYELAKTSNTQPVRDAESHQNDLDKLEKRRQDLNEYAKAIGQSYGRVRQSMFRVLGQLARLNGAPYLPCVYDFSSLDDATFDTAADLARDLTRVWNVAVERIQHPWYGFTKSGTFLAQKSAIANEIVHVETVGRSLLAELTRVYSALGVSYSGTLHDAETIHDVACVVDQSPGIEPRWLSYDANELGSEIASWQECFHQRQRLDEWLKRENAQHAADVGIFTSESWQQQRRLLDSLTQDRELQELILGSITGLQSWLRTIQTCISRLNEAVGELQQALDIQSERSIQSAVTLLRAASAADSTTTPERSWFERATYTALREALPGLKVDLNAAESAKQQVLERYDEALLQLDLDTLIHKFSNEYKSILRVFKRHYRATIAQLRANRKDGVLPKDILTDLREARDSVRLYSDFNRNHSSSITMLGSRYRGTTTDFAGIAQALDTVRDLHDIIGNPSERLIQIACGLAPAAPLRSVCATLERLVSDFRRLRETTNAFNDGARFINMEHLAEQSDFAGLTTHLAQASEITTGLHDYLSTVFGTIPSDIALDWVSGVAENVDTYRDAYLACEHVLDEVDRRFGSAYLIEGVPDWSKLTQIARWLANRHKIAAYSNPTLLQRLRDVGSVRAIDSKIKILIDAFEAALATLRGSFVDLRSVSRQEIDSGSVDRVLALCTRLAREIDRLQEWHDYVALRSRFAAAGLGDLFEKLEARSSDLSAFDLVATVRKSLIQGFVDHQFGANAVFANFRGSSHTDVLCDFTALDRLIVSRNGIRVVQNALERRPQQLVPYQGSESRVLLTEAGKKRRHLPIRKLFARMPRLLQQLKPCLLMSPLSVSQFLDPESLAFDCVIFDEASQICSEDAVSAIYRGRQLVVCGDKQQLPPTAFFKESADENDEFIEDEEDVATFESILAESETAGFPSMQLKWHYRSAHESLIAFSNERFYNHSLITFPSATSDIETTAVDFCYVPDGVYDRGGRRDNPKEADRVVQLVLQHIAERPSESLGVVAFSKQQADAIQNRIDVVRKQRHDLEWFFSDDRVNGFFVKNLERVQGDERDRIIFSVGYGRDKNGRLTMSFGPLNIDGGEKRLNVAVTRARSGVTVASSIRASDMDLSETTKAGVLALHKYLDFAERGYIALDLSIVSADYDSPFEEDVAGEIRAMGYSVFPQVGVSGFRIDLGVTDPSQPGHFILGVECDGATYHSSYSARDRDRLRQEILESKMKWKLHRIWSPDWVQQRAAEIERLRIALEAARSFVPPSSSVTVPVYPSAECSGNTDDSPGAPFETNVSMELASIDTEPPEREWLRPYSLATITSRPLACEFHDPAAASRLSEMAWEVVVAEAPVHKTVVASRVAKRWGLTRVGSRMLDAMESAYRRLERCGDMRIVEGCFLTPNHDFRCDVVRCAVPGVQETLRPIEHISAEELAVAIRSLLSEAVSFEREQLIIQVARALGYDRTGSTIRERVSHVLSSMVQHGILEQNADRVIFVSA